MPSLVGLLPLTAAAQSTEDPILKMPVTERMLDDREIRTPAPESGDSMLGLGVPYSRVMRDTEPPYEGIFRKIKMEGEMETKLGEAAATFHANFFRGLNFETPLTQQIRPEASEFKLGNFYIDLQAISASILYSDNINQVETNPEDDALMAVRLHLAGLYQLGEKLRLSVRGAFIYLPLTGDYGVVGFGIDDLFGEFGFTPLAQARLAYDLHVGHWEIQLINDFLIQHRRFGEQVDFEIFHGATFEEQNAGRYRLKPARSTSGRAGQSRRTERLGVDLLEARNSAGGIVSRMLPTDTRFEVGGFHQNRFYFNRGTQSLPDTHDYIFANLINEREEMRFKPFANYRASTYDTLDGWDQRVFGGLHGPITEYIGFHGGGGYIWLAEGEATTLYRARLDHNPTALFYHQVQYQRHITEPERDVEDSYSYRLRYTINKDLRMDGVASYSDFEDLNRNLSGSQEYRAGLRFNYHWGDRAIFDLGEVYSKFENEDPAAGDSEMWTTRFSISYRHSETLESRLMYWHRIRDSNLAGDSYRENVVMYTMTKYF